MKLPNCRLCNNPLQELFCDLGMSPLSNSYLTEAQLRQAELFYPLRAYVCATCYLVQLIDSQNPKNLFSDYAYFSSYSETWLNRAKIFADEMRVRFGLGCESQVVEIASNDGYLLQYFKKHGIPVLGIEPAANVASVAMAAGVETLVEFFGTKVATELANKRIQPNLIIGNNVLAHVPDLNDFVSGMRVLLGHDGVVSVEFPHVMRLIQQNQFDTIYHEHFSYLSLISAQRIFSRNGLKIFDVVEIPTHGGSLRLFACHSEDIGKDITENVDRLCKLEVEAGLNKIETYTSFAVKVQKTKRDLLRLLAEIKEQGKTIVGYGAPAKGNTLLNYCGIGTDFLDYTVDLSPHKQGRFLPGTHIPIYSPQKLKETKPNYVLILPWNIKDEIMQQTSFIRDWNGKFVIPIPHPEVIF